MSFLKYVCRLLFIVTLITVGVLFIEKPAHPSDAEALVLQKVKPSIVMLENPARNAGGTGFELVTPIGKQYTITNGHVCDLATDGTLIAVQPDGPDMILKVVVKAADTDLCALEPIPYEQGLHLKNYADPGSRVFAVGHPSLRPTTVASGFIVARKDTQVIAEVPQEACFGKGFHAETVPTLFGMQSICIRTLDSFFTSVQIYPGNSGSPMVDGEGNVEGVFFAASPEDHYGSAIPLDVLESFVERLK